MNNELLFEEIFQESPVPSAILRADAPDFTIIEVNRAFLRLTENSREDLKGNGIFHTAPHPAMRSAENAAGVR